METIGQGKFACVRSMQAIAKWGTDRMGRFFLPALLAVAGTVLSPAVEAQSVSKSGGVVYIGNDRGGVISERVREIDRIAAAGQQVVIKGSICYSTCTMFLGAPGVCVYPTTTFGFHGPSYYGRSLSDRDFEYWSQVIASYYPAPLQSWYLAEGRTRLNGQYRISGAEIIRLGARQCEAGEGA